MDYYNHEFEELHEEFEDTISNYPLFKEMIDDIYDKDIKEINSWLEKNDEFYLKKANSKLKEIIKYVKDTSTKINDLYQEYSNLASLWEKSSVSSLNQGEIDKLNNQINIANEYIHKHDMDSIEYAIKVMKDVLKKVE